MENILEILVTALFIPIINWIWHQVNYLKFKGMLKREYVNSVKYEKESNSVGLLIEKLGYLKDKEISHLSSPNQFKYIRVIEYTLMFLNTCQDINGIYNFTDTSINKIDEGKIYVEKYRFLKDVYKQRLGEYVGLRRDTFMTEKEREELEKSIRTQLEELHNKT